jgi:uncharacterized protein (DUF58 family)
MSTVVHKELTTRQWLARLGNADFCPWANRYVYWLKEPIGWFAVAGLLSVLVGLYVSPVGWALFAAIASIIAVGMAWPYVAVRMAVCHLRPALPAVHEGDEVDLILQVRNLAPLPLWGIAVEGYLERCGEDKPPTVALSCVPGGASAEYRLSVRPEMRGSYPEAHPQVSCAFPFGLWTARRPLAGMQSLTVWPRVMGVRDERELPGGRAAEVGEGTRTGQVGETIGLRGFRQGDRLRNIHWVQTARLGELVVCERGGPQKEMVELTLESRLPQGTWLSNQDREHWRESLAYRVRVAASLGIHFHARHIPLVLRIDGQAKEIPQGPAGKRMLLDRLALVPLDGNIIERADRENRQEGKIADRINDVRRGTRGVQIAIRGSENWQEVEVSILLAQGQGRHGLAVPLVLRMDWTGRLEHQMGRFWREVRQATEAA